MNGTTTDDRQRQLLSYLLLGVLLAALTGLFFRAWEWASRSWFWIGLAGGTNASYSPGPLIPVMVLLMFSTRLRRLPPTPEIASRDRFHAAFQTLLLPVITAALKAWHQMRGVAKSAKEQEAEAYSYRAYGVWIVWVIPAVALAILLFYARQLPVLRPIGHTLLFLHLLIFSAAIFYMAWRIYHADKAAPAADWTGQAVALALLVFFLLFHIAAVRGDMPRISVGAFLGCLVALVWFFYGWRTARIFIFPLAFMVFTLPMEWIEDKFGLRAQMLATKSSVAIMDFIGLKVNMIGRTSFEIVQGTTSIDFSVSAPCSGLKSLVALTAISATYGYVTQRTTPKMVAIMLCGPFLAVLTNIIRLVAVGVTAQFGGQKLAMVVHDHALPIYILGILLLMAIDKLINSKWLRIEDF